MAAILTWLPNLLRRRKWDALLAAAQNWPTVSGKLLASRVVERNAMAEGCFRKKHRS